MKSRFLLMLVPGLLLVVGAGCSDDPVVSTPGTLQVAVYDAGDPSIPVENVEITILPGSRVATTDASGKATFELPPGTYFVDANVCCVGPGWIEYHEEVAVTSGDETDIVLNACLLCLSADHEGADR